MKKDSQKKIAQLKVKKVMKEYMHGKLRSGSKHGPEVTDRSQALAIAISESKKKSKK